MPQQLLKIPLRNYKYCYFVPSVIRLTGLFKFNCMHKCAALLLSAGVYLLAACGNSDQKKVVVMASGKIEVKGDVVKFEPGTQHNEAEVVLSGNEVTIDLPGGKKGFAVTEPGVYVLNLQKDTLIGSIQRYGETNEGKISQETLMQRMDSLQNLMVGTGVTDAKKNYFIPPMQITKITTDQNAIIRGAFRGIPASIEPIDGKVPEVYKFITNKDARETLDRLKKMMTE
jgi:hypothetical protein